ncbi:MAG: hypothetical protein JRI36_09665 [Deltaproteobacteria bacterium]|nr:hypothetical protein [Deltaproteobacteria bacterium]
MVRRFVQIVMMAVAVFWVGTAWARDNQGPAGFLAVGVGLESLSYEEHEPDTSLDSEVTTHNWTFVVEALKDWERLFLGIDVTVPLIRGDDQEVWRVSGDLYQTNRLENRWIRIDGTVGYLLHPLFKPFMGLRWSQDKQERTRFVVLGTPVANTATETVESHAVLIGLRGKLQLRHGWACTYGLKYLVPIYVKTTNDSLPGWEARDKDGYTVELKGNIGYSFRPGLSVRLTLYGGKMHWEGSDWKRYSGGSAKWPENDTVYWGLAVNTAWFF